MENAEGRIKRKSRLAVFEHVVEKTKSPKHKKFRTNRLDLGDSSASESELVIDDDPVPVKKKRYPLIKLTEEPLHLVCEWGSCNENFESWKNFNTHLIDHLDIKLESLECQWKGCNVISANICLLEQHLSYHGYLSKLKNIGQNVLNRNNLPQCTLKENYIVPIHPQGYSCEWEYCSLTFGTIYDFYTHMEIHVHNNPSASTNDEIIECVWGGCNTKFLTKCKLGEHVRTHTKEKVIACPTCCALFSNKTKFCDHRKRQLSTELQSYQCSQCLKLFPTERLLRDHMRSHINHFKCTMCDMTCPKPSILAKHIRFKHVKYKPYKCRECSKSFVAKHNLDTHLRSHGEKCMVCSQCDFKCRTKAALDNHYTKVHKKVQHTTPYECHCCRQRFKRGGYLTKHLMKVHNYHWPSGHSRFRYRKDQDNIYRLQTVRYESLEVTQEMIRSETMQTNNVMESVSYNLRYDDGQSGYVLSVMESGEQSVNAVEPKRNNIIITINDVDEHGNILKSEVVESREVIGIAKSDIEITQHSLPDLS